MSLRMVDIHWAAGMLEGEGSFGLGQGSHPLMSVSQADIEPLEKFVRLFGGNIYPCKPNKLSKKPLWAWHLNTTTALGLMMTIYPLMTKRRQGQIRKVVAVWRARPQSRVALRDSEALALMRRVYDGEAISRVVEGHGIHWITLSKWLKGIKRPELLAQLKVERPEGSKPFNQKHKGASSWRWKNATDDVVFAMMRLTHDRQKNKEPLETICRDLLVSRDTMEKWLSGQTRPYLLARLLREEGSAQEE